MMIILSVLFTSPILIFGDSISDAMIPWVTSFRVASNMTLSSIIALHDHQNPKECTNKLFLIAQSHNYGHGSSWHMQIDYLALALNHNRILLYDDKWVWAEKNVCPPNRLSPDCYFLPLSLCQYDFDMKEAVKSAPILNLAELRQSKLKFVSFGTSIPGDIPRLPNIDFHGSYQLWLGNALRYIMRLTHKTKKHCLRHLMHNLLVLQPNATKAIPAMPTIISPPNKSIAMFIRHSDKKGETKLHSFGEYMDAADGVVLQNGAIKHIILGTDNEHIIENLENNISERRGYTFYYTMFARNNDGDGGSMRVAATSSGVYNYTIGAIADLMIGSHPNINSFIVTSTSNWNRLIHELVISDGYHTNPVFIDLQK